MFLLQETRTYAERLPGETVKKLKASLINTGQLNEVQQDPLENDIQCTRQNQEQKPEETTTVIEKFEKHAARTQEKEKEKKENRHEHETTVYQENLQDTANIEYLTNKILDRKSTRLNSSH